MMRFRIISMSGLRSLGVLDYRVSIRFVAWYCLGNKFAPNSRVCIITGPRIDLAEDLIARFKGLFNIFSILNDRTDIE
jgi:hypothetical protein